MVCLVKAMVFPVTMYGCESWTMKKAEHGRIDASELQANSLPSEPGKHQIMASGPITSWQIDGETLETVRDFIFGGLQNHCRW